ncbi:UvrD-helicase domain-containing protein [Thermopolyspora sp. NPDC052614]|uniref:UvrD-helicase domain-containing protein n=1 Tax=Thermopolyspora sp. NPDC052614 TaxID=3155682 RepID=UPI0034255E57
MTRVELTDPQNLLVNANGSVFVEACPGAGKTKALVARFVRRIGEETRKGIALISFANAAIDEVTSRCSDRPESLNAPHFVGTFDAFIKNGPALCWRAEQRRTDLIKGGILSSSASRALAAQWLTDPKDRELVGTLLAHRFAEIIVDEAQDCGADELAILELLRESGVALVLVADLDQSIYEFRRSLPNDVRRFSDTLPRGQRLDGNFRSSPAICRITASVRGRQQVDRALGPYAGSEVPIHLVPYTDLDKIRDQAVKVAERYGLAVSDITFLAHRGRHARQAAGASASFQTEVGENKVLRIAAAGRVLADPTADPRARLRARNDLEQILLALVGHKVDLRSCDRACAELGITPAWLTETAVRMALALNTGTPSAAVFTARLRAFLKSLKWPKEITPAQLRSPTSVQWQELLAAGNDSLSWSTIHQAKGRQFPAVGLVIPKSLQRDDADLTALDYWEQGGDAEAKRVLYVGVSRAEQLLMLLVHKDHVEKVAKILVRDEVPYE